MGMNVVWSGEISLNDFLSDSFPSPFRVSAPQALSLPPTTILAFFVVAGGHWGDTTASWLWAGPQQPEAPQPPPRPGMRLCPPAHATGRPRALPGEGDVELRPRAGVLSAVKTLYKLKIRLVGVETYSPRRRAASDQVPLLCQTCRLPAWSRLPGPSRPTLLSSGRSQEPGGQHCHVFVSGLGGGDDYPCFCIKPPNYLIFFYLCCHVFKLINFFVSFLRVFNFFCFKWTYSL